MTKDSAIDIIHKTIYGFFDVVEDDSEESINEKDKLLLEVNKVICNAIKDMPDDERKTGRWINDKGFYRCSTCNELWCHWWASCVPIERMNKIMHFCPNCGAKMEGVEE